MSAMAETAPAADPQPTPARERRPRGFLVLGLLGAAWFIWLMVESGLDLRVRSKVGALVELAQAQPQSAAQHAYVAQATVDPNGAVRMTLKGEPELDGRHLVLLPQRVEDKVVGWRCESDAPRRFLPRNCNLR